MISVGNNFLSDVSFLLKGLDLANQFQPLHADNLADSTNRLIKSLPLDRKPSISGVICLHFKRQIVMNNFQKLVLNGLCILLSLTFNMLKLLFTLNEHRIEKPGKTEYYLYKTEMRIERFYQDSSISFDYNKFIK